MFKKIFGWIVGAVLAIGAGIAYFFGTRKRDDRPGVAGRIGKQLDSEGNRVERERAEVENERELVDAERTDIDRERESIDGEREILDRDKKLIAELKRRAKK